MPIWGGFQTLQDQTSRAAFLARSDVAVRHSRTRAIRKAVRQFRSCKVGIPHHIGTRMPLERVRSFARRLNGGANERVERER